MFNLFLTSYQSFDQIRKVSQIVSHLSFSDINKRS